MVPRGHRPNTEGNVAVKGTKNAGKGTRNGERTGGERG